MFQVFLQVEEQEIGLEIFFKQKERGDLWLKHHYLIVQEIVWKLRKTRSFDVTLKRIY